MIALERPGRATGSSAASGTPGADVPASGASGDRVWGSRSDMSTHLRGDGSGGGTPSGAALPSAALAALPLAAAGGALPLAAAGGESCAISSIAATKWKSHISSKSSRALQLTSCAAADASVRTRARISACAIAGRNSSALTPSTHSASTPSTQSHAVSTQRSFACGPPTVVSRRRNAAIASPKEWSLVQSEATAEGNPTSETGSRASARAFK